LDDLEGKVALVTGASRGIGKATAITLAKAGADVAVNYLNREKEAHEVCSEIESIGRKSIAVSADVSIAADATRLVKTVARELGSVAILVNNAGIARPMKLEDVTEEIWDETISMNLKSVFLVTQAALPSMRVNHWGRIVSLSSIAAHVGGTVGPHYAASKAGVQGLTHAYAAFLAKEGITANAIAPALVYTEMIANNPKARSDLIPVGRFGRVEEVAEVVLMLVRNGYITGQTINVDGGWYMS
jgi:3-oxoacyl-[acyl-carrier protein] reductase